MCASGGDLTAGMKKYHERKKMSNNADIEYSLKEDIFPVGATPDRLKMKRLSVSSTKKAGGGRNSATKSRRGSASRLKLGYNDAPNGGEGNAGTGGMRSPLGANESRSMSQQILNVNNDTTANGANAGANEDADDQLNMHGTFTGAANATLISPRQDQSSSSNISRSTSRRKKPKSRKSMSNMNLNRSVTMKSGKNRSRKSSSQRVADIQQQQNFLDVNDNELPQPLPMMAKHSST